MADRSVAWDQGDSIPGTPFRHLIRADDTGGRFSTQSAVLAPKELVIPHIVLEFISPAGFEHFFEEMGALKGFDPEVMRQIAERYGQTPHPQLVDGIQKRHGVSL